MTGEQLQLLVDTVQQLSLARDLNSIMSVVRKTARQLTGADGATFILREHDLCYYADEDAISPLWKGQRFPMSSCVSGWVMMHRRPLVIENIYSDSRIPIELYKPTFVRSLVMVPIRTVNPIGAIGNYWADQCSPSSDQIRLLQALADITSVSIENFYAFDELETFIYKLSHDIRGPIARILGLMNITNLEDPVSVKEFYAHIGLQAESLDDILKSLVDTISIRKEEKTNAPVIFEQIVCEAIKSLENINGYEKVTFEQDISVKNKFLSNKILLITLFHNLIDNAIKYRSEGVKTPIIKILVSEVNDKVKIMISDNGIGIPEDVQQNVFKMFFRGTEKSNGSGLGLYLVSHIIKQLNGEIFLDSKEHIGTTVTVYLRNESSKKQDLFNRSVSQAGI
ncbi:MAG: HAMP domain-containing histidine kinase [Sporocytophaga sp.]|uniref:GAF domain-containing sensor histidine kinase n=1 Tax=Sporocytophaga sp. TaxID=2231183 RepID=UPI001B2BD905|nr:HAMP domain-containing sensor histidine kinase [Sporocytophaga sp.]MBO9702225.1 HAMP domain-containing histidine kinase [Sporocytophaga sp.]